jgi:lipopolysaccharide export system permease protein
MKILDRYLISDLIGPFLLGIAGFILIMTVDLLFTFVDMIINKGVPTWAVIRLIFYKLPAIMVLTFPVSFLFATTFSLGQLAKDSELSAMRTSGISFLRISIPILAMAIVVSGMAFFTNEAMVPLANRISDNIIKQIIYKQPLTEVKEQTFFKDNFNRFFYIRKVSLKTSSIEDVMIYELNKGYFPRVIIAKYGKIGGGSWELTEGTIHTYDDSGRMNYESSFSSMKILVDESAMNFSQQKTTDEMNSKDLKELIATLNKGGVDTAALSTDFMMKISIPVTTFVFALLAIPLSIPAQRAGKAWGFVISIVIMFTFYVFASVFRSMGRGGMVMPFFAAWFPPILVSLLGTALLYRELKR